MGIRLNKAMTILNVGKETIVEYLKTLPGLEPITLFPIFYTLFNKNRMCYQKICVTLWPKELSVSTSCPRATRASLNCIRTSSM